MVFISLFSAADFGIQMNPLLCVTIASVFVGFGYFLCLNANASVAGFDVIALIINKRFPKIKVATTLRCISIIVLLMGYASFGHQAVIYGIIFSILETQVINVLMWMAQRVEEEKLVFVNIFADELNSRFIDKREYFY